MVSPTRLGDMLASAENMVDPDGELTDGETFRMGNVQEYFFNFSSKSFDDFCLEVPSGKLDHPRWNVLDFPRLI